MLALMGLCARRNGRGRERVFFILCILGLAGIMLSSCDLSTLQSDQRVQHSTFTGSTAPITYNTGSHDVLIRTFHAGGLQGSLQLSPDISIYGDGTYLLGLDRQGELPTQDLHQLLNTLVDTDGLLDLKRQQFTDIQDQNATFLELALNNKQIELMYGPFNGQQVSQQDRNEYQHLGHALAAILAALKGPIHPYNSPAHALLVHQTFGVDYQKPILYWHIFALRLAQIARYECGDLPIDETSPNAEAGCLKYLIPHHAILLTAQQFQTLTEQLSAAQQGVFAEGGSYYLVTLRPLLPDEISTKTLAMFGSAQSSFQAISLHEGAIPPPTPTPGT